MTQYLCLCCNGKEVLTMKPNMEGFYLFQGATSLSTITVMWWKVYITGGDRTDTWVGTNQRYYFQWWTCILSLWTV